MAIKITLAIASISLFSSVILTAAPYHCASNGATYSLQAMCNTVCGTTCEDMNPNTNNAGVCDTANYDAFVTNGTKTYGISKTANFWTDFSSLAIPKNVAENTLIGGLANYFNTIPWIGIYDPLKSSNYNSIDPIRFKDKNGMSLAYSNWASGEPNNALVNEDIGVVAINGEHWAQMYTDGTWNDHGYHKSNGGDYKPKFKAITEWNGMLACVSGVSKPTTSSTTGYWCGDGAGNVAQCSAPISTSACTDPAIWNSSTQKCESGMTTSQPADARLEFTVATAVQLLPWLPPTTTTTTTNTLTFYDAHFSCGKDWEMDSQFQIDKSTGNLKLDVLIDRCYYYGHFEWYTWTYISNNPNSITWYEDQHVGPTFTVTKNIDASISLYRNGIESNFIEWYTGASSWDEGTQREKMSIKKVYSCSDGTAPSGTTCTVSTLTQVAGACTNPSLTPDPRTGICVSNPTCPLGNYPCADVTGAVENTDAPEGQNDKQADGATDSSGACLGTMYIFNGNDTRCRPSGVQTGASNCCQKGETWFGLGNCSQQEKTLGTLRKFGDLDGNCHYVGDYCTERWPVVGCVQKKKTYCCFSSPLARVIQEGGRPQLGLGWGTPQSPDCRGFTPEEFQKIDFSKVDFSDWIQNDVIPNVQNNAVGNIQNVINNIDTNLAP